MKGFRVLVMRPSGASDELARLLRSQGAHVIEIPGVSIEPGDAHEIDEALERGGDWAIFASASAVAAVVSRGSIRFARVAAVGESTARALRKAGVECDFKPEAPTTESLARTLPGSGHVTVFRSAAGSSDLEDDLRSRGFDVVRVDAYRSQPVNEKAVSDALISINAAVLTSASIATTFARALEIAGCVQPIAVSIGPVTTKAAKARGIRIDAEARTADADGLVAALQSAIASRVS
ncbi:MAG: uroporphyrinogen-III synthase [Actinomycetota bacterium]